MTAIKDVYRDPAFAPPWKVNRNVTCRPRMATLLIELSYFVWGQELARMTNPPQTWGVSQDVGLPVPRKVLGSHDELVSLEQGNRSRVLQTAPIWVWYWDTWLSFMCPEVRSSLEMLVASKWKKKFGSQNKILNVLEVQNECGLELNISRVIRVVI